MPPPQKIELTFDYKTKKAVSDLTRALQNAQVTVNNHIVQGEELHHDEDTLFKVRDALKSLDISVHGNPSDSDVSDMITVMQNAGILFRERKN